MMNSGRRRRGRWWTSLAWITTTGLGFVEWSNLVSAPIRFLGKHSFLHTLRVLVLGGEGIYDGIGVAWGFLALSVALVGMVLVIASRVLSAISHYIDVSQADLSMLSTDIDISLDSDIALTTARIVRKQLFHANSPDVEAYHYSHTPEVGRVDWDATDMSTSIGNEVFTRLPLLKRPMGRGIEIIETYRRRLPTSIAATYLPDFVVLFLHKELRRFGGVVAEREATIVTHDEYNTDTPSFQLESRRYPANRAVIRIHFPVRTAPDDPDIEGFRIRENSVIALRVHSTKTGSRKTVWVEADNLYQERIRIQWKNDRLKAYLEEPDGA